jgi:hypothetical protein
LGDGAFPQTQYVVDVSVPIFYEIHKHAIGGQDLFFQSIHKDFDDQGGKGKSHRKTTGKTIDTVAKLTNTALQARFEEKDEFFFRRRGNLGLIEKFGNTFNGWGKEDAGYKLVDYYYILPVISRSMLMKVMFLSVLDTSFTLDNGHRPKRTSFVLCTCTIVQ